MRSGVEQSVCSGSVFLHEDVLSLRGSREFQVRSLLSRPFVLFECSKNKNKKPPRMFNNPVEALVSAPSENILSWVPPEG